MTQAIIAPASNGKFNLIEIGRAVAAILVVFHHTGSLMSQPRFYGAEPFRGHFENFNVGVDFFFVLSGFIITWIHRGDIGQAGRVGNFARKRFLRIFPPYWIILIFLVVLYQVVPNAGVASQRDPVNILLSVFLLPYTAQPVLGVAWTLTHEIFFYGLFALVIAGGQRLLWLFPAWALAIIAWNLGPAGVDPTGQYARDHFPLSFMLSAFNLEFLMGVAAAEILRLKRIPYPLLFVLTGVVSFLGLMLFATEIQHHALFGRMAFAIPSVLFVLGAVEMERQKSLPIPRLLALLGAASYAIYLVHPVALSFFLQGFSRLLGTDNSLEIISLVLALLATVTGVVYHIVVETPAISFFRKTLRYSWQSN
ncbi:acyltransferase [Rhizobium sp. CG5]|uniref:acyltransferase family protein n=1 Tax=Rhizobium sp. CG5 TaxID=2726076 RepID=UPI0020333F60|nr:acyltransferase [Rhizobium sp. CG5]MCM2476291.1 acyltransferase [Rhizobium sp. CG5]